MAIDPRRLDDLENNPFGGGVQEIDGEFLEKANVSWFTRILLRIAMSWGLGRLAKELNGPGIEMSKRAHSLFANVNRVDLVPLRSDLRGFRIVVDSTLSIYFVQDGDHFVYDGFELGPLCEEGDVTIFDGLD